MYNQPHNYSGVMLHDIAPTDAKYGSLMDLYKLKLFDKLFWCTINLY